MRNARDFGIPDVCSHRSQLPIEMVTQQLFDSFSPPIDIGSLRQPDKCNPTSNLRQTTTRSRNRFDKERTDENTRSRIEIRMQIRSNSITVILPDKWNGQKDESDTITLVTQ